MGGLGLTCMELIGKIAYNCSISTIGPDETTLAQKDLTLDLNRALVEEASQDLRTHLRWGRCASWIHNLKPNPHYRPAILQHIWGNTAELTSCDCGVKMPQNRLADHALGCSRVRGVNASSRHKAVKSAIIAFCEKNAIPISDEPVVYYDGISTKRCDLRITLPTEDVYVDVTVANATSKTYSGKALATIERMKMVEKEAKYLDHVSKLGGHLVTFVAETRGTLAPSAVLLCKRLNKLAILKTTQSSVTKDVQTALARTNGAILANVLRPKLPLALG